MKTDDGPKEKARILITDDEAEIRSLLSDILSKEYDCTEARSAEEALELIGEQAFDLVISDIMMGGMSGLEMVPRVLERSPDTVVVMISGVQTVESAIEALRAGAFDYIMKPFDIRQVEAAVRRALEYAELKRAKRIYETQLEQLVEQRTAQLDHLAYYDVLTDLPNRLLFMDRIAQSMIRAQHDHHPLAVMFVDVDRFKTINDTLGHTLGDKLLLRVASRLISCVSESDTVARFNSNEFALLLTQIEGTDDAVEMALKIDEELKKVFDLDGLEIYLTSSVGIALYPDDGLDVQTLIKNAGAAMYRAKEQGGDNYQFYTSDMQSRSLARLEMEGNLRRALEREEFIVYYQPQVDIKTGQIAGMEALLRWHHPERGIIPPVEFIHLAEDTGLIVPLGEWVLRTACAQNKAWLDAGVHNLRISVNLSARQFQQPNLVEMVAQVLEETKLSPACLELELTESSIMKDANMTIGTLRRLKEMGIQISIDDFGTGYSSLAYLKRFPIDMLKIDRSFICDTTSHPDDAALVMTIIMLAHNLNLRVVAEGVETNEQLAFLRLLRCDEMQGYLFSKPLPAEGFNEMLLQPPATSDARKLTLQTT